MLNIDKVQEHYTLYGQTFVDTANLTNLVFMQEQIWTS